MERPACAVEGVSDEIYCTYDDCLRCHVTGTGYWFSFEYRLILSMFYD